MNSNQIKWTDINETRRGRGVFRTYCSLISSCEECDKKIRFLCKIRNKIENLQTKIITKILNKRPS